MAAAPLTSEELAGWTDYVHRTTGIDLDPSKAYLLETRLGRLLGEEGAPTFAELLRRVTADVTQTLRRRVIDAITTNETSFFRDQAPFELLRHKIFPELIDRRSRRGSGRMSLRIWSAACSTGQEVYSTAIVLKELLGDLTRHDVRILGTDISDRVLAQASYGEYGRLEMDRGLPPDAASRHFRAAGDRWRVGDELRALATFHRLNLLEPFAFPHPFDLILCRNVAIYFREEDRTRLFRSVGRCLAPDGYLVLGATEPMTAQCPELEAKRHVRTLFYQLRQP